PLQGINGTVIGDVPLLGQILTGIQGEGIFGITFAVQGSTADPQVIVNPLSLVTPGIFREIFAMTTPNPKVQPREDRAPTKPVEERVRAAPPTPPAVDKTKSKSKANSKKPAKAEAQAVDGWSSTTTGQ